MRRSAWLGLLVGSLLTVGCGAEDGSSPAAGQSVEPAVAAGHVHGLGVNQRDDSLIIATHNGLFRAAGEGTRATPYGDSRQDVMGFSTLGPDRLVGSGHPDPRRTDQPPNLGLIDSTDGGRTWKSVSLLGGADFHVLEAQGERIYGFDGAQGRLIVSRDGGRTWQERRPPAAVYALAIDPRAADRVVVSTEDGVFTSADAGRTWRAVSTELVGLLAWPPADRLLLVDGAGTVRSSADGGRPGVP